MKLITVTAILISSTIASLCSQCLEVLDSQCFICYSNCNNIKFENCTQSVCEDYFVDENGTKKCSHTINFSYSQSQCLVQCCEMSGDSEISFELLDRCQKENTNSPPSIQIVLLLIPLLIGGCLLSRLVSWGFKKCQENTENESRKQKEKNCISKCLINLGSKIPCFGKCFKSLYEDSSPKKLVESGENKKRSLRKKWKRQENPIFDLENRELICGVCRMKKPNVLTNCKDAFHLCCIIQYMRYESTCPTCLKDKFNPIKIFCEKCSQKYFEIHVNFFSYEREIMENANGPNCPTCS